MKLLKVTFIEVGELENQNRRVFEWNRDGSFVNDIVDVVERNGGRIGSDSFVGIAGDALSISTHVEDVYVPGIGRGRDWSEKRFRFFLEIELEPMTQYMKRSTRALVQGYTDHSDITRNDLIDPNMNLYINNVTTVNDYDNGAHGITTRVIDVSQTILGDLTRSPEILVRPSDVFARIENNELAFGDEMQHMNIVDTRSSFQAGTQLNNRRSNSASHYLHTLVSSDIEAEANLITRESNMVSDNRDTLAHETSGGNLQSVRTNPFLRSLANRDNKFKFSNRFKYADLADFTDGMRYLDDVTTVVIPKGFGEFESESWGGASAEVKAAAQVCHMIPIIMIDCFVDSIIFDMDNTDCRGDQVDFVIEDMTSMLGDGLRDRKSITAFETRMRREVFSVISNRGHMRVDLHVNAEVCGVTIVEISIEGDSVERYVFPSFADGLLSPVVSNDMKTTDDLADGYTEVRKMVDEVTNRNRGEIDLSTDVKSAIRDTRRGGRSANRSNHSLVDDDILDLSNFNLASIGDL